MDTEISIDLGYAKLGAFLNVPDQSKKLVIFAHGSGSSRFSPRNQFVAQVLNSRGIATLLADLLTQAEDVNYQTRFDIDLLTNRLTDITKWVLSNKQFKDINVGYFGASTGAAAAMRSSLQLGDQVKAIVSRGGRVDLAADIAHLISAPTLLIVGSLDYAVLQANQEVYRLLQAEKELAIIEGAGHLFEEPGALEQVADLSSKWFEHYL